MMCDVSLTEYTTATVSWLPRLITMYTKTPKIENCQLHLTYWYHEHNLYLTCWYLKGDGDYDNDESATMVISRIYQTL